METHFQELERQGLFESGGSSLHALARQASAGQKYLSDNFPRLDPESRFLLKFFHDAYALLSPQRNLLEVGGGGALYSLISARSKVSEITYGERLAWGREAVRKWERARLDAHDWRPFFEETRRLEEVSSSVAQMMAELRSKLTSIVACDIFAPQCGVSANHFDVVSSHFCAESVSRDVRQFQLALRNLSSVVAPGGYLILSLLDRATYWDFGDARVFCANVDRDTVVKFLTTFGFEILLERQSQHEVGRSSSLPDEEYCQESARGHNYQGLLCLAARRG